jgi:arylsulfatase A-like enzyme
MTGQPAGKCYIRGNITGSESKAALEPAWTTLPEIFKAAGYATGAYGKWGLGQTNTTDAQNPLMHGFDEFCGWKNQVIAHTYYPTSYVLNGKEIPLDGKTYVHDIIMDKAFGLSKKMRKRKNRFSVIYLLQYLMRPCMRLPICTKSGGSNFLEFDNVIGKYGAGPGEKCPDVQNPIAGFAAMMEHLDNQVGELLEMLKKLGIDDNTIIMFASDNGAHKEGGHDPKFWNSTGGLRGHKRDMHEGGIRTPMLARWPGVIKPGLVSDHISGFHDVVPTVADLLKQPVPTEAEGISFLPTLKR